MIIDPGNNLKYTPNIQALEITIYLESLIKKVGNTSTEIRRLIALGRSAMKLNKAWKDKQVTKATKKKACRCADFSNCIIRSGNVDSENNREIKNSRVSNVVLETISREFCWRRLSRFLQKNNQRTAVHHGQVKSFRIHEEETKKLIQGKL